MSKYTPAQLKSMAQTALAARDSGDFRWPQLQLMMQFWTNLSAHDVERKITALAEG